MAQAKRQERDDDVIRGLDHVAHAVRDLDAAARFYENLGFTVGARNQHPWGTCNRIVQMPGFFIELVSVADVETIERSWPDSIGALFGRLIRSRLIQREGFAVLMLESTNAAADETDFKAHGIGRGMAQQFTREATLPDGESVTVGFALAFARDELSPHAGFAASQQLNPDAFWNAAFQKHRNGAIAVSGVVMTAENPSDHHIFLEAFTGDRAPRSTSLGLKAETPRGDVEIVEAPFFRDAYGQEPIVDGEGLTIAALRIATADIEGMQTLVQQAGIPALRRKTGLVISAENAFGATLVFEPVSTTARL
jgi:hypothetical protein